MFGSRLETIRGQAATSTFALIRADRKAAPKKLKPLLAYIEEHLFDPGGPQSEDDAASLRRA